MKFCQMPPPRTTKLLVLSLNIHVYIIWSRVTIRKYRNYNEGKIILKVNYANYAKLTFKNFTFILIYKFYEHFIYDTVYNYYVVIKQAFYYT